MKKSFLFSERLYSFDRIPPSGDHTLQAWNAADEYFLLWMREHDISAGVALYHDRFGFLTTLLAGQLSASYIESASQYAAILSNQQFDPRRHEKLISILTEDQIKSDLALIKLPKSLEMLEFYLDHAARRLNPKGRIVIGFMTRHFTKNVIEISQKYFDHVEQTKAWRKSRLMILSQPKEDVFFNPKNVLSWNNQHLVQFKGVFSSSHIDYATQFLLSTNFLQATDEVILDIGCGNGIISYELSNQQPGLELHMMDDSYLAIASARLNLSERDSHFYTNYQLRDFASDYFDLVITNPPFHFDFEVDMTIALQLFEQVPRVLKEDGRFVLVANVHLNYKVHLVKLFKIVKLFARNDKFEVFECSGKS